MKITFNPLFYLVCLIVIITGQFKTFMSFLGIICFHELGHVLAAILLKWKIDRIVILPFGGITIFNEKINRPIAEEFLIAVAGPIFQIFYNFLFPNIYHKSLLIFNLLPIVPLDGSKIFNLLLNKFFPFSTSHKLSVLLSILLVTYLGITKHNLTYYLILSFLFFKIIEEVKMHPYLVNNFLYERYRYFFNFKKRKIINSCNMKKMYRDYYHIFKSDNHYKTEREMLKKRFDNQKPL